MDGDRSTSCCIIEFKYNQNCAAVLVQLLASFLKSGCTCDLSRRVWLAGCLSVDKNIEFSNRIT